MLLLLLKFILGASGIITGTAPLDQEIGAKKTAFNSTIPIHSILITIPIHAPITLIANNLAPNTTSVITEGP